MRRPRGSRNFCISAALLVALLLPSCRHDDAATDDSGGAHPTQAISLLNMHLVNNDLAAFARAALPPERHARLDQAWTTGSTRWPLDEFPLAAHYPSVLAALSADNAHAELMAIFDQQLAGAEADLQQTALLMSVFMTQFIQHQDTTWYSESEQAHYSQLVAAAGHWASTAPLADRARALQGLELLIPAARTTGLTSEAAFAEAGMDEALRRLTPVLAAFKHALALYGLDLNAVLSAMQLQVSARSGDQAEVQMRYRLGTRDISASVQVEQLEGRWYVSDLLRHATIAVAHGADEAVPAGPETF